MFVSFEINKTRYHGGTVEGNYIQKMFQNTNEIFKAFEK